MTAATVGWAGFNYRRAGLALRQPFGEDGISSLGRSGEGTMKSMLRTCSGLLYAALVAFYGAFIAMGVVFLVRGLTAAV
jgi:hypothetical protein